MSSGSKRWKNASDITDDQLQMLQNFVKLVKFNKNVLHLKPLRFFKEWLEKDLQAKIPETKQAHTDTKEDNKSHQKHFSKSNATDSGDAWKEGSKGAKIEEMEEEEDSDFEVDKEGVIPGDTDPAQDMGDDTKEVTESDEQEANNMKMLGIDALNDGDCEGAIIHFTSGIKLDCTKTALFIKRATAYIRLKKPNAATRDAEKALSINPDSAAAHKVLGKAQRLLGEWERACHHLEEAQKIDFDDSVVEMLKDIKPKANRIREHRLTKQRKLKEKQIEERRKRAESVRKAQEQARKEQEQRDRENMSNASFNFGEGMNESASHANEFHDDGNDDDGDGPKITEMEDDLD